MAAHTDRHTHRQTHTQTHTDTHTQTHTHRHTHTHAHTHTHTHTGDQIRLGVDVVETNGSVHRCLVLDVCIVIPSLTRPVEEVLALPVDELKRVDHDTLVDEVRALQTALAPPNEK